jgi:hypothetical protein
VNKYVHQSSQAQTPPTTHLHDAPHPGPAPTHSEIAQRAYQIYLESGCSEGHSMQNWLKAEQELMNLRHWRQADRDIREHSTATSVLQ